MNSNFNEFQAARGQNVNQSGIFSTSPSTCIQQWTLLSLSTELRVGHSLLPWMGFCLSNTDSNRILRLACWSGWQPSARLVVLHDQVLTPQEQYELRFWIRVIIRQQLPHREEESMLHVC